MQPIQWGLRAAVLASLVAASLACEALIHLDDRVLVVNCAHRQPPPRPTATAPSPTAGTEAGGAPDPLVLAVWRWDNGSQSEDDAGQPLYRNIGFDLDNTCTGEGQGPSCVEPSWATAKHDDGVDGIDNAYGQLSQTTAMGSLSVTATNLATTAVPLLRVRQYSGEADDNQVEVCLYMAFGLTREDGGGGPSWDGNDRWTILSEVLESSDAGATPSVDRPRFCDERAYVSGGVLVAHFPEARWPGGLFVTPTWLLPVEHVVVAGTLTQRDNRWELQDLVTGFSSKLVDDLIALKESVVLPVPGASPICQVKSEYERFRRDYCAIADIASVVGTPSAPCDSVSAGFVLQAKQAQISNVSQEPSPPQLAPCDPGVPENDTCDSAKTSD
jgi:hypothetical protein